MSHCLSKFGDQEHYGSEDIVVSVFHVILQNHGIKRSYDFKGRNQLK